ncbi:MAG: hypothetical protein ACI4D5_08925 [Kineothrix sp.]
MRTLIKKKTDVILLLICMGFYLFFPLYDGPVWCVDSASYASMHITREPLYPVFLWIFRSIFGEEAYLMPVVLVQSLIAGYAAWRLAVTVREETEGSLPMAVLAMGFQFGVTFLCRFVANRGSAYTGSIMTEGLGLSLYLLFILRLYRYVTGEKGRDLAATACLALLLVNLRKQMLITLCLMAAVFVLYNLLKDRRIKKLLFLSVLTVGLLFLSRLTDRLYNYCVRGAWIEHSGNSMGLLCTLIYTSSEEDAGLFREEELRRMYLEIHEQAWQQGLNIAFAPEGWEGLSTHYADSYDAIGYGIINPVVQGVIREGREVTEVEEARLYDGYCSAMAKALISQEKGDLLRVYGANTLKGFINSIARVHPVLNPFALSAYGLYLSLYIFLSRKKKGQRDRVLAFAEVVMGGIIINTLVVGAMIFCQPRYMIYSMGLFYGALSLLVYDCIISVRKGMVQVWEKGY